MRREAVAYKLVMNAGWPSTGDAALQGQRGPAGVQGQLEASRRVAPAASPGPSTPTPAPSRASCASPIRSLNLVMGADAQGPRVPRHHVLVDVEELVAVALLPWTVRHPGGRSSRSIPSSTSTSRSTSSIRPAWTARSRCSSSRRCRPTATHYLHDWDLAMTFSASPVLEGLEYVFKPSFSISLAWRAVSQIKAVYKRDGETVSWK
ncbi:MAG: hypothetical protein MZV70_56855 [Desulfobacterales bacterium]|nr:hypothetical protein [Desulfobacterales bacterium]